MYEFNSAVQMKAPDMKMGFTDDKPFTFTVSFQYPNAFQGTFKQQLRYLRDNTCDGTDVTAYDAVNKRLKKNFFEDDYSRLKSSKGVYEAFNEKEYYGEYSQRYFTSKNS